MSEADEQSPNDLFEWAHQYDGYARLALTPETLTRLIEPARQELFETGHVPSWCGVDYLRGWMFWLARAERFGGTDPAEWEAVADALRNHPSATDADRPPTGSMRSGPTTCRVMVWNTEWAKEGDAAADWLQSLRPADSDLAVLSEVSTEVVTEWGGFTVDAGNDWGYRTSPDRRKILMWSRNPWREVRTVPDGAMRGRIVRGVTDTPFGEVTVVGVCIPWRMAHVSNGRKDAAPWQEHREFLEALRGLLAAEDTTRPLLLAGDLNQTLPRTRASQELGDLLQDCLVGGRVLTAGHRADVQLLDHVVVFNGEQFGQAEVTVLPASQDGRRLSDHDLVEVRLSSLRQVGSSTQAVTP